MKQVICLGFYCQLYKKNPLARLYLGDTFIDEFEILEYFDKTLVDFPEEVNQSTLSPNLVSVALSKPNQNIPKLFCYIIDNDTILKSRGSCKIQLQINDSNYINGFMTKSTSVVLSHFYIIPLVFFEQNIESVIHRGLNKFSKKTTSQDIFSIKKYYKDRANFPISLTRDFQLCDETGNFIKYYQPYEKLGKHCELKIKLNLKHNIWWGKKTPTGYPHYLHTSNFTNILKLWNKYLKNEN